MVLHKNLLAEHLHIPKEHTHADAIHGNVAGEIEAIFPPSPVMAGGDLFMFEAVGASYAKRVLEWSKMAELMSDELGGGPFLPLAGGTISGLVNHNGNLNLSGDLSGLASGGASFNLHQDTVVEFSGHDGVGYDNATDSILIGDTGSELKTLGALTHPKYNGENLALLSDLDDYLPLEAGASYPLIGDLYVHTDVTGRAKVIINANGYLNEALTIEGGSGAGKFIQQSTSSAHMFFDLLPIGTAGAEFHFFEGTDTTNDRLINIYTGQSPPTLQHQIDAGDGDVTLCKQGGDLIVDTPSDAGIKLRAGGDTNNYGEVRDFGWTLLLRHFDEGNSQISLTPIVGDGSSAATISMFQTTVTDGQRRVQIYDGEVIAHVQHTLDAGTGDMTLCQQNEAGTLEWQGNTVIVNGVNPYLILTDSDQPSTSYNTVLQDRYDDANESSCFLWKKCLTGGAVLHLDAICTDEVSEGQIKMFRSCNSAHVDSHFTIYNATNTETPQHTFNAKGDVTLCQQAGKLTVGGPVQLPYLGAAPSGLTNGMMWMESDGLHIYYAGAEKLVAGV